MIMRRENPVTRKGGAKCSSKEDINNNHTAHVDQGDFKHVTNQQKAEDEREAGGKGYQKTI